MVKLLEELQLKYDRKRSFHLLLVNRLSKEKQWPPKNRSSQLQFETKLNSYVTDKDITLPQRCKT